MKNRYYDKVETPAIGKTFTQDGVNRIIQTDERVKNWFEPVPEGYQRAYDGNGLPFNELIPPPTVGEQNLITYNTKIATIAAYKSNKFITHTDGNVYNCSTESLIAINDKVKEMLDAPLEEFKWFEYDYNTNTPYNFLTCGNTLEQVSNLAKADIDQFRITTMET